MRAKCPFEPARARADATWMRLPARGAALGPRGCGTAAQPDASFHTAPRKAKQWSLMSPHRAAATDQKRTRENIRHRPGASAGSPLPQHRAASSDQKRTRKKIATAPEQARADRLKPICARAGHHRLLDRCLTRDRRASTRWSCSSTASWCAA